MRLFEKFFPKLFALFMAINGAVDLTQPEEIIKAVEAVSMPSYLLYVLGIAKLVGGLTIVANFSKRMTDWAFAGFFVWAYGGISAHIFSGHGIAQTGPLLFLSILLVVSFFLQEKRNKREESLSSQN